MKQAAVYVKRELTSKRCNKCSIIIQKHLGYFCCSSEACSYAYCAECNATPTPNPNPAVAQDNCKRLKCLEEHRIVHFPVGANKQRHSDDREDITASSNIFCNGCRKLFDITIKGFYSCKEKCDYSLCPECATCDYLGHVLVIKTDEEAPTGLDCSRCSKPVET